MENEIFLWNFDATDWFAAKDRDDARAAYSEFYGGETFEDLEASGEGEPARVSEAELDRLRYIPDPDDFDADDANAEGRTFREQLQRMKADPAVKFPCFFASTEF